MSVRFNGFQWDHGKAIANIAKHGVSFAEAATAFDDPHARMIGDPDHSCLEDRFIIIGNSTKANLLVVCHCRRCQGRSIRIISARRATKRESSAYWRWRHESGI